MYILVIMIIINIGLPKTMTTELRIHIDKYTNINSIQCPASLNLNNCIFKKHLTT